jgi:hypothetical protein
VDKQQGGCAKAAKRLDPGVSSMDQGGEVEERSAVSLHQNRGRSVGPVHGASGRKERRWRTQRHGCDVWRRGPGGSVQRVRRGGGVWACGPFWAGQRGLCLESSAPFYLFEKLSN